MHAPLAKPRDRVCSPKALSSSSGSAAAEAYVPLLFAPGEAYQFDWSAEIVSLVEGLIQAALQPGLHRPTPTQAECWTVIGKARGHLQHSFETTGHVRRRAVSRDPFRKPSPIAQ